MLMNTEISFSYQVRDFRNIFMRQQGNLDDKQILDINNHFSLRNGKDTMVAKILVLFHNTYGNIYG